MFLTKLSKKEKENALNEVRILASINHPNIVQYKEAFLTDNPAQLCIVMEYVDGGDLYEAINEKKSKNTHFEEAEVWEAFIQIVKGLKHLHEMKVLH